MTLTEVLITLVIAVILSLAAFSLIDVTMRRAGEINTRVDSVQRGRGAMDEMTRELRSQICLGSSPARVVVAATATSVTFYAYTGDSSTKASAVSGTATPTPVIPERLSFSLESGTIIERRWVGTPAPAQTLGYTFAANPTRTRQLLKPAELVTPTDPKLTPALFRYYAYDPATDTPTKLLVPNPELSDEQMRQIASIQINFRALPTVPRPDGRAGAPLLDDVTSRTLDPNTDSELPIPCQ
jgi:hypothetical protein